MPLTGGFGLNTGVQDVQYLAWKLAAVLPRKEFLTEVGLIFGARYESAAIVSQGAVEPPAEEEVQQYVPSVAPGCCAPPVWLERAG